MKIRVGRLEAALPPLPAARGREEIAFDAVGDQGDPVLRNRLHLEQLGPDALGHHGHVIRPIRQPSVTGRGQDPFDRTRHEAHRIVRQLRREQRVHVEDHRDPPSQAGHRTHHQPLEMVRVDHVHPLAAEDPGQRYHEQGVEQQQLSVGGTGAELVVAPDRADPTDIHARDRAPRCRDGRSPPRRGVPAA